MRLKLTILILLFSTLTFGQGNQLYKFISKDRKYGFIDTNGNVRIKPVYLMVMDFSDGVCFVSKEVITNAYKWICIDTVGNEIFDIQDNFPETGFSQGFARISSFKEQWFINKKGINEFKKVWKDGYQEFNNGIAYVSDIQFSSFYPIDTKGNKIGNRTYSSIEIYEISKQNTIPTTDSLIRFKQDSLWGFKNINGEVVIQPKYYLVDHFQNGLCAVRLIYQRFEIANDWYFDAIINTKGQVISQQPMHCYMGFQGNLIEYYGGPHFGGGIYYLNKSGQKITPKE